MGVMFFADPVAAFRNIGGALKPGGRLVFACWAPLAENRHWLISYDIALRHLGPRRRRPITRPDRSPSGTPNTSVGFSRRLGSMRSRSSGRIRQSSVAVPRKRRGRR